MAAYAQSKGSPPK
jgi:site-specific DNA-cytosine methylase